MKSILIAVMLVAFGVVLYVQHEPTAAAMKRIGAKPKADAAKPLARTLRTVSLGWELLAPGVSHDPNGAFTSVATMADIEAALAKGGGEVTGADVALVPLSSYVASYEKLRALSLDVVFVVGWSRREALYAPDETVLTKLPAKVKLQGAAGAPETFLALFLLDLAGTPASRVDLVPASSLAAVQRSAKKPGGKLVVTSADTPYLMPIVAVAPRGFAAAHRAELEKWAKAWLAGVTKVGGDVPAAARLVATLPGAPPVVGIIEALGQIEFASLRENAASVGLSGRGALTLDENFKTTWRIWRDAGVLTTPAPESVPLDTSVIASLVRADPKAVAEALRAKPAADAKRPQLLLVVKHDGKLEPDAFVAKIGFVAGVFDRLPLRVSIKNDAKTAESLIATARERFALRNPLTTGKSATAIEVLTAP